MGTTMTVPSVQLLALLRDVRQAASAVFLRNAQLTQIASTLRPYTSRKRTGMAETAIEVDGGKVTFRQVSLDSLADVSISFTFDPDHDFPKIALIFSGCMSRDPSPEPYHVDASRLVKFARIGAVRGGPVMRVQSTGANKPVLVTFDPDLVGLLMPVRVGDEAARPLVPVYPVPVLDQDGSVGLESNDGKAA